MSLANLVVDYVVRYGFHVLGATVILAVGAFRQNGWARSLSNGWTGMTWNLRSKFFLLVRLVKIVVIAFALLVALDQLGFQIAPLTWASE